MCPRKTPGARAAPRRRGRRRILVVDDNEIVRDAVALMLRVEDHEVHTASNRAEALRLLEAGSYDVIVSDLGIPNLDGPRLYRELKALRPEALARLIFMTGHVHAPEYVGFLNETRVPVLAKPFSPEDLRQAVQRALRTP